MICNDCGEFKPIENRDLGLCATCNKSRRTCDDLYPEVRKRFLDMCITVGAHCPVTGEEISRGSDIHHKKGRQGYADEDYRRQGITLLIDARYFLAVSRTGHQWIETHPQEAKSLGYTLSRLT